MTTGDPVPEPGGSLRPPIRYPPTAVGVATPPPPQPPVASRSERRRAPGLFRFLRRLASVPLALADLLAEALLARRARR